MKNLSLKRVTNFKSGILLRISFSLSLFIILNNQVSFVMADDLRAYPTSIVFREIEGNPSNVKRSVLLFTTSNTVLNWTISKSAAWITSNISDGATEGVVKIGVNISGMQPGLYTGNIVLQSPQSTAGPVTIPVTLIINPDVPVTIATWKDGIDAAMSVSVDSRPTGFTALTANGYKGTYFFQDTPAPSYLTDYYNVGMEIGSHTINHPCVSVTDDRMKYTEIEPNVQAICTGTPMPCKDVISFAWPCGFTNYREESDAGIYFLSARGYNINKLEETTPEDFMNLKSYNSHEHEPYPPEDLRTVIDSAITLKKWFNLVLHQEDPTYTTDVNYAHTKNIWVAPIGTVIKYIVQRDRFILTDYIESAYSITFGVSRLAIPSTVSKNFELAFGSEDMSTIIIDIDDGKTMENLYLNGVPYPYQIKNISGNLILYTNVKLETASVKAIEVRYVNTGIPLTISGVTANNKAYNGSTSATINTGGALLVGVLDGDDVTLVTSSAIGTFTNKNIGTGKTVMTSGFSLTGANADKYSLQQPTTSADITPIGATISGVTVNNKVYDRTTTATLNTGSATLSGVLSGDQVTLIRTGATGTFSNKNVGNGKTVTISGFTLGGTDGGNYTLTQPAPRTANITAAPLTITGVTANDKIYDGSTAAALNTGSAVLNGVLSGDAVTLSSSGASGTFENALSGTAKIVYTSGFTVSGTDAGNYSLTQPTTTASIIGIALTITGVTVNNKTYNGTTAATLNTTGAALSGVIPGDAVTLVSSAATGTFNNKNVGTAKPVNISGFTLSGADVGKYSLTQPSATGTITAAGITITGVTANNKVYNGTTAATLNTGSAALAGVVSGDIVTLVSSAASATFNNKNAGTGKTVTISGFTLSGTDSGNYTLTQPAATANITVATLTITGVTANNKVYNATTAATLNTGSAALAGVITGDAVTLGSSGVTGAFVNKNAGTGKTVTVTGFTITGSDIANYTLAQPAVTANITQAVLTITGVTANNKVYNGNTSATLNTSGASLSGVLTGDVVTAVFTGATGTFSNKNVETAKMVTITGITPGGTDGGNYIITQPVANADITVAPLTIAGVTVISKTYDGTVTASLNTMAGTLTGRFGSDDVTIVSTNASGSFADKNAGTGKPVTVTGFTISGSDAFNYTVSQPSLSGTILVKSLKITANDINKPYRTTMIFTGTEYSSEGLIPGDILPPFTIASTGSPESAPPGNYVITISGGPVANYSLVFVNGTMTIGKYLVTATADNLTRYYGSENPVLTITYSGFVNGDDKSVLDELPVAATSAVEGSIPGTYRITLSGGSDSYYALKLVDGSLEVLKAPLDIIADNKSKVYGESNTELTISYSGFVLGQDQSVLNELPVIESSVADNSDAGEYEITISGASAANYNIIYHKGIFNVEKADQVITFEKIPASLRMTQELSLEATVSSGLPVEFKLSDNNRGRLTGNLLTLNEDGHLVVTARQEGNQNYKPAEDISQSIDILPTFDNISSLFTPNADGMNDYWYIPDLEHYGRIQVTVYNRYGQIVYESEGYKNDWDGTWNGNPLPSASYYYIIRSSQKGFLKGVVNIVR